MRARAKTTYTRTKYPAQAGCDECDWPTYGEIVKTQFEPRVAARKHTVDTGHQTFVRIVDQTIYRSTHAKIPSLPEVRK